MILTLAAIAAVTQSYAQNFKFDLPTIGGAVIGWAVAGPVGAGALGFAGNKMGEHERQQDAAIASTRDDVNVLGNYVASEPWKAKIMQAQENATESPKVEPKQDWRKACIPQGTGGL